MSIIVNINEHSYILMLYITTHAVTPIRKVKNALSKHLLQKNDEPSNEVTKELSIVI